ncbi:thioredoxin family protein [Christiangramia portivictoriae]|uniref:thioredoxin family protein n=1 Tax=Christiangramia portivictoriae TaxID=326069 RepID=UPI00040887DE|nr:thioredoxin family protein [Christiangramia portivictoriae]
MKKLLVILAAFAVSCGNKIENSNQDLAMEEVEDTSTAQQTTQKSMLLGDFTKEELQQAPFKSWFDSRYESFEPDTEEMATINENINDYEIKVLMGTWCGDSKRELPKFLRILDEADYDYDNLQLVAVDRDKATPSGIEQELEVTRVPTIIFYKDGKEVNRFVEYSQGESIEEDIARIVSGKEYKNSYAE